MLDQFKWNIDSDGKDVFGTGRPFSLNSFVNDKIHVYYGEAWKLPVDAIVLGQNENLTERIDGNEAVFQIAGPVFDQNCIELENVNTGTAAIVEGGNLGCQHVIFAVGPKYDKNFLDASISALHTSMMQALTVSCYS